MPALKYNTIVFSTLVMSHMNDFGRVSICGSISSYNEDPTKLPKVTIVQPAILMKQLKVEGFIVWRWGKQWSTDFAELIDWIKSGKLKATEHVTEGFDKIYDAFVGMMAGENYGKAIVKV